LKRNYTDKFLGVILTQPKFNSIIRNYPNEELKKKTRSTN